MKERSIGGLAGSSTDHLPRDVRVVLPFLLCPSDFVGEGTNYRFCGGSNLAVRKYDNLPEHLFPNGSFQSEDGVMLAEIEGGTTTAAAFSERLKAPDGARYQHQSHIWPARLYRQFPPPQVDHALLQRLANSVGTTEPGTFLRLAGRTWHAGGKHFTVYDHVFPPNPKLPGITATIPTNSLGGYSGAVPPTARHVGGVNVAFVGGQVQLVANSVDLDIWRRLGSIDR